MKMFNLIVAAIMMTTVTGCSTIIRGSSEEVLFHTFPSGAEVRLSTGQVCHSPCTLEMKRKGDVFATITKDGYKTLVTVLISSIDGVVLAAGTTANILSLPIINDLVDYNTRANYSRKPNPLIVELIKEHTEEEYLTVDPGGHKTTSEAESRVSVAEHSKKPEVAVSNTAPNS